MSLNDSRDLKVLKRSSDSHRPRDGICYGAAYDSFRVCLAGQDVPGVVVGLWAAVALAGVMKP